MSLFSEQITMLLAVAAGYDNRKPGELNTGAWLDAAHRGRWTYKEAVDAIKEHYANEVGFVMPGHVNAIIRQHRNRARQDEVARQLIENPYNIKSFRDMWEAKLAESKPNSLNRKALVMAYPDLVAKLTQPPIGFRRPEEWSGWIPPELDEDGQVNPSRRAAGLRALVEEAERRARAA